MKKYTIECNGVMFTIESVSIEKAKTKARNEYYNRTGKLIPIDQIIHHKNIIAKQDSLF